jgi:glycolate oxidase FAD binding subunit
LSIALFQERIREAAARRTPLRLRGGGSKDFYGNQPRGEVLDMRAHAGIVAYEPSELVVTARCGTPLRELEEALARHGQFLAFEPPHFGPAATLGGCVAAGLSGPRRANAGALRDYILGVKLVDGRARLLSFGGQVMKNVAGYDVSRLAAGSLGTLGVIAEVSLKVLPVPPAERTLRLEMSEAQALENMNRWAAQPLPISATAWCRGELFVRLSGSRPAVRAAAAKIGGTEFDGAKFWPGLREHAHEFFGGSAPLWRIAVPSMCPPLELPGETLLEWGGGLRWNRGRNPCEAARKAGGHATLFRSESARERVFDALDPVLMGLHRRLKAAFDPEGLFNPGRLYPEL